MAEKIQKKKWDTVALAGLAPVTGLILVTVIFAVLTKGKSISSVNAKILINNFTMTALAATGMMYCFASGAIDMSPGGSICLSAIVGALAGNSTGSFPLLILSVIVTAFLISLFKGVVAAYLTLPIFIVTLIFGSFLSAAGLVLLGSETTIHVSDVVSVKNNTTVSVAFVVSFYLIAMFLFNYTRIGKECKLQGGNPLASAQSGINAKKCTIISFMMSGVGIALAALITIFKTKTVTAASGGTIGNDVLMAVVLGGMPLTGGAKSKMSAALIGTATITILNNGLSICNVSNDVIQIIRGIIFIIVVFISSFGYRTKYLPH